MSTGIEITRESDNGVCLVRLSGTLDLSLGDQELVTDGAQHVVFDFDGVRRITSFGILMWTRALEALQAEYVGMVRCRPAIVQQLNVVSNFAGNADLISVYLPFVCDPCDKEFDVLWGLSEKHPLAVARQVEPVKCPKCFKEAEFDDVPKSYFSFADRIPAPQVPTAVSARLLSAQLKENSRGVKTRPPASPGMATASGDGLTKGE